MIAPGAIVDLEIEKPAAGGRMLARHEGQVVLVSNAIPGERVQARIEKAGKGVAFAETVEVVSASPDRRAAPDWRCGGNVLAHVQYARQLRLKGEILQDAFARVGRLPLAGPLDVVASPEQGYRMRARLHARGGTLGFYREATHELCDPEPTRQLLPSTIAWIREVEAAMPRRLEGVRGVELSEDVSGQARAAFLDAQPGTAGAWFAPLAGGDVVVDRLAVPGASGPVLLQRSARSFFQGNRYLLEQMTERVASLVPDGPVVDLYAGVGLFGLVLAARGHAVTLVEGDQSSGQDLLVNAQPYLDRVQVRRTSVEAFAARGWRRSPGDPGATCIIDPPRTGVSKDAMAGLLQHAPPRIVYVSCDPATLARDARTLVDAGYQLGTVTGLDLFPNTAHVEAITVFVR